MSTPKDRAAVAGGLLAMHPAALDCTREETLVQMLSDLMHHAAAQRLDFETLVGQAQTTHRDELADFGYFR
ncbi:MAG: hypothetical protein GC168_05255 [Candidatus Hydrogenedens sp.]|nr:hypothetical protein [Candidatus Hydrogenedens sp.]